MVGPTLALAKAGASADSAEEMKDTTGVNPWRLHDFGLKEDLYNADSSGSCQSGKGWESSTSR